MSARAGAANEALHRALAQVRRYGAIGPRSRRGRRFGAFGDGSMICFPPAALVNEHYIHIGAATMIGPHVTLSAGMVPGQLCVTDPVVRIGDRCLIGRGSGIVGHLSIEIGDDVWTGHHVYVTDQNHGYDDLDPADLARSRCPSARCASAPGRGSDTARWCSRAPTSAGTWSSERTASSRGDAPGPLRRRRQPGAGGQAPADVSDRIPSRRRLDVSS